MVAPDLEPHSLDLIWSEGAITHVGWETALGAWRELLRPGGVIAFTDATWLVEDPPEAAQAAWNEWYPGIRGIPDQLKLVADLGFTSLGHFALPRQDWWDYLHLADLLCERHAHEPDMAEVIQGMRVEADLYRECGASYGYVFHILRA